MDKYRIVEHSCHNGKCYEVQKRFLGFLWWYNFENVDGWITGVYDTLEEAEEAIERARSVSTSKVIKTYQ